MEPPAKSERHKTRDEDAPLSGPEKTARIDLGLGILSALAILGTCYTQEEIAAFAGCTKWAISLIEQSALKKLRYRLFVIKDPVLEELVQSLVRPRIGPGE